MSQFSPEAWSTPLFYNLDFKNSFAAKRKHYTTASYSFSPTLILLWKRRASHLHPVVAWRSYHYKKGLVSTCWEVVIYHFGERCWRTMLNLYQSAFVKLNDVGVLKLSAFLTHVASITSGAHATSLRVLHVNIWRGIYDSVYDVSKHSVFVLLHLGLPLL